MGRTRKSAASKASKVDYSDRVWAARSVAVLPTRLLAVTTRNRRLRLRATNSKRSVLRTRTASVLRTRTRAAARRYLLRTVSLILAACSLTRSTGVLSALWTVIRRGKDKRGRYSSAVHIQVRTKIVDPPAQPRI